MFSTANTHNSYGVPCPVGYMILYDSYYYCVQEMRSEREAEMNGMRMERDSRSCDDA